jgi:hypothetical protein
VAHPIPPDLTPGPGPRKFWTWGKIGGAIGTVVTIAATVAGLYITVIDRPKWTTDDWRQQANAVCERDTAKLMSLINFLRLDLAQWSANPSLPGQRNADLEKVSHSLDDINATFRSMNAGFREIKRPGDEQKNDIESFLNLTGEIGGTFSQISSEMVSYQLNSTNVAAMTQITTLLADTSQKKLPDWSATARRLGLTQCPDFTTLSTPAPTATGTTSVLSAAQKTLAARVDARFLIDCRPPTQASPPGATAALWCQAVQPGPNLLVNVIQFADLQSLNSWASGWSAGLSFVDCGKGDSAGSWTQSGTVRGRLACRPRAGTDKYIFMWTFDNEFIGILADGPSRDVMFQWWLANVYVVLPA